MRQLFVIFLLLAQISTPKPKFDPESRKPAYGTGMVGAGPNYCGGGLTDIPQTNWEAFKSIFSGPQKGIAHVNFAHPCFSKNPGAKTVTWMWVLHIEDITNPDDSISNLRTLNETAVGMDIEGIRGHTINWTLTTR